MSRMMHLFRKYQYMLLIVFGVLLMFVFVIGDALNQLMDGGAPGQSQSDDVVLTWKHGTVSGNDLYSQRVRHNMALEFLSEVIEETVRREGTPKGPNVYRDQLGRYNPGITVADSDEAIVQKMLLAAKAESLGVKVDNDGVMDFLTQLSDGELVEKDFGVIFNKTVGAGKRMTQQHLMDQLQHELLAEHMIALARTTLMSPDNNTPRVTPYQAWQFHNRMHRRVQTEMVALKVDDFKDQVSQMPSDAEIKELYEEAKDRFANPFSPEPGFMRRRKLGFEYVRADSTKLQEEEAAKVKDEITEEDIAKYYEENKERYRVIELPESEATPEAPATDDAAPKEEAKEKTDPAKEAPTEDTAPAPPAADEAATEPPAEAPGDAAASSPATDDATTDKPAAETPATDDSCGVDDEPTDVPTEAATQAETSEAPPSSDTPPAEATPAESATTEPAPEPTTPEPKATDTPAEAEQPTNAEAKKDEPQAPESAGDDKPQETTAEPAVDSATAEPAADAATDKPEEPRYKPLDDKLKSEIRDEIAADRSRQPAQQRLDKAFEEIKAEIDAYGRQLRRLEVNNKGEKPPAVNYEELAAQFGFTAGKIDPTDVIGIEEYDLGKAYEMAFTSWPPQRVSFAQKAFFGNLQTYRAERIKSAELDVEFLYWSTAEEEAYVPELVDIRDEVIDAWKRKKAFEIAKAEAEKLASQAAADKPFGESLGEHDGLEVIQPSPFSWMSTGSTPFGGAGAPTLSAVDGVEAAGNDFMASVFGLAKGETAVAVNQPQTMVYVVRVAAEMPSEELLREQFLSSGVTPEVSQIAFAEIQDVWQDWYSDLEEEMNVKWK